MDRRCTNDIGALANNDKDEGATKFQKVLLPVVFYGAFIKPPILVKIVFNTATRGCEIFE